MMAGLGKSALSSLGPLGAFAAGLIPNCTMYDNQSFVYVQVTSSNTIQAPAVYRVARGPAKGNQDIKNLKYDLMVTPSIQPENTLTLRQTCLVFISLGITSVTGTTFDSQNPDERGITGGTGTTVITNVTKTDSASVMSLRAFHIGPFTNQIEYHGGYRLGQTGKEGKAFLVDADNYVTITLAGTPLDDHVVEGGLDSKSIVEAESPLYRCSLMFTYYSTDLTGDPAPGPSS